MTCKKENENNLPVNADVIYIPSVIGQINKITFPSIIVCEVNVPSVIVMDELDIPSIITVDWATGA
jgi:hypothetical protein